MTGRVRRQPRPGVTRDGGGTPARYATFVPQPARSLSGKYGTSTAACCLMCAALSGKPLGRHHPAGDDVLRALGLSETKPGRVKPCAPKALLWIDLAHESAVKFADGGVGSYRPFTEGQFCRDRVMHD